MKVVILAGGFGTRLGSITEEIPKPMVEIGGFPIIHHIMEHYSSYGFKDFIIALGYKSWIIKNYFLNYHNSINDISLDMGSGKVKIHYKEKKDWKITLVDTGLKTMTGGRLKRLHEHLSNEPFMLTYGDGLSNVDLNKLLLFHKQNKKIGTVTSVRPVARFGEIIIKDNMVKSFKEKPQAQDGWINGGFFVFESRFLNYIKDENTVLEADPLENLSKNKQLGSFKHKGFWQCMDTKRDHDYLVNMWETQNPPWKENI